MKNENSTPKIAEEHPADKSFREQKSREESKKLSSISHKLLGLWDLMSLWAKLQPEESLILSADGSIYKGRVKTDKLSRLKDSFVGKTDGKFDGKGKQEFYLTKSWAHAPSPAFKNAWDLATRKGKSVENPAIFHLFMEKLEMFHEENLGDSSKLKFHTVDNPTKHSYYELEIPDFPIICAVNSYGGLVYYIFEGKRHDI